MWRKTLFILLAVFIIIGCNKPKGEFAFKRFNEDAYRRIDDPLEFERNERIKWVYAFKDVKGIYNIGITLLKKEIVWVDINNRIEIVSRNNKIIYGIIENLNNGKYKIKLNNEDQIIDERDFIIFTEEEEYYKYED